MEKVNNSNETNSLSLTSFIPHILTYLETLSPGTAADEFIFEAVEQRKELKDLIQKHEIIKILDEIATRNYFSHGEKQKMEITAAKDHKDHNYETAHNGSSTLQWEFVKLYEDLVKIKKWQNEEMEKSENEVRRKRSERVAKESNNSVASGSKGKRNFAQKLLTINISLRLRSASVASFENSALPISTVESVDNAIAAETESSERNQGFLEQLGRRLGVVFRKYSSKDVKRLLLILLSNYHRPLFLQSEIAAFLAEEQNLLHLAKKNNQKEVFNQLLQAWDADLYTALGSLLHFIEKNSVDKEKSVSKFATIVFTSYLNELSKVDELMLTRLETFGKLLLLNSKYLFSRFYSKKYSELNGNQVDASNTTSLMQSEDSVSTKRLKEDLKEFYVKMKEDRFIPIIDDLFSLYSFPTVAKGIYEKYSILPDKWRELLSSGSYHLNMSAYYTLDLDAKREEKAAILPTDKTFHVRVKHSTEDEGLDFNTKHTLVHQALEEIVTEEILFYQRLHNLSKFYVEDVLKKALRKSSTTRALGLTQKEIESIFDPTFYNMLHLTSKLSQKLEILNLISDEVETHDNLGETVEPKPSRLDLLINTYLDSTETIFNVFGEYILNNPLRVRVISDKQTLIESKAQASKLSKMTRGMLANESKLSRISISRISQFESKFESLEKVKELPKKKESKFSGNIKDMKDNNLRISVKDFGNSSSHSLDNVEPRDQSSGRQRMGSLNFFAGNKRRDFLSLWEDKILGEQVYGLENMSLVDVLLEPEGRVERIVSKFFGLKRYLDDGSDTQVKVISLIKALSDIKQNLEKQARSQEKMGLKLGQKDVFAYRKRVQQSKMPIKVNHDL